ncbi:MAG: GNAT family N-acetyltransferase [Pseudomonadota bacterium]
MNLALSVRRAEAEDGALLRNMRIASLTDAPYAFGATLEDVLSQTESAFIDDAKRHSTSNSSTSFFLFSGGAPAGMIGAFFERAETTRAFICALWVEPTVRGTSAASLLVSAAIEWLTSQGAKDVFAWVANDNVRAVAFYRKAGFVTMGEVQPLPSDPSQLETLLCFSVRRNNGSE